MALHRGRLLRKYVALILSVVGGTLLASSAISAYFSYQEIRAAILTLEREKAEHAASRINEFVRDIERQISWTTLPQIVLGKEVVEHRRLDFVKLLKQAPAISELAEISPEGREQMRLSRLGMDAIGSGLSWSDDPRFLGARDGQSYFGPVYFRKQTEPYMSIAARTARGGVVAAEVNLKFVWNVVNEIRVGQSGYAYVVNPEGKLIAHPDISLVLQQTDLSVLPQVAAALPLQQIPKSAKGVGASRDRSGRPVLASHFIIERLGWVVIVEQPSTEALAPLYASLYRTGFVLFGALILALVTSLILAQRMAKPISSLRETAAAIGSGELARRIDIKTGDELQDLAEQFNDMAAQLNESYSSLELKVAERTALLAESETRTKDLLHNILPASIAAELVEHGQVKPVEIRSATILFTDFSGFTQATNAMPAERMVAELNDIFSAFDDICRANGIEKIKTIGDAYMAASGVPQICADHAQRAAKAGLEMIEFLNDRNCHESFKWSIRVGIHSGPVVAGVVGKHKYAFDVWGDTVNTASRMESAAQAGRVNISAYTYDLIRHQYACEYRGKLAAKGRGEVDMYFITGLLT